MKKEEYAKLLYDTYVSGDVISKDVVGEGIDSLAKAYEVQHLVTAHKEAAGESIAGYKIGLTNDASQKSFGASEPIYGQMTAKSIVPKVEFASTNYPRIELELVFIAQHDLSYEDTAVELLKKVIVAPALEIPDSRYEDWAGKITAVQFCSDCAVSSYVTYGEARPATYDDISSMAGVLLHNSEEVGRNTPEAVLGHPALALEWLVKKLGEQGLTIKKGMFVSSGTFIPPQPLKEGIYEGLFEGLGNVTFEVL